MTHITGTASVVLGPVTSAPAAPPHTYLGVAQDMVVGLRALADASPTSSLALGLVAAHVLECTLKAYLSRGGSDHAVKGRAVRHNLSALWSMARADGLPIPRLPPDWVKTLSGLHDSPFPLRYSTGVHGLVMPGAEPMATEIPALLALVRQHCR